MINVKILGIVLFLLVLLDLPVIMFINKKMYTTLFEKINAGEEYKTTYMTYIIGTFTYLLIAIGLTMFVVEPSTSNEVSTMVTGLLGLVYGLVVYGVYNGTNSATLVKYDSKVAMIDTLWGSTLCGIVAILSVSLNSMVSKKN